MLKQSRTFKTLALFAVLSLGLLPFNNCGNYAEPKVEDAALSSVTCGDADCVTPTAANISIKPHLGTSGEYGVPPGLSEFNIGGDCNEGGYAYNLVRWELRLNNVVVRHSDMAVASGTVVRSTEIPTTGATNANSRCVNGHFLIFVNLSSVGADAVNRTGLLTGTGTTRAAYDLWVEIYGQEQTGVRDPALRATVRVPLSAL